MRRRQQVTDLVFHAEQSAEVVARMHAAATNRDEWLNLRPLVEEDRLPTPSPLAMFGPGGPVLPVGTWVPGTQRRKGPEPTSIGLGHPRGQKAVAHLTEVGIVAPPAWILRSDHVRRGVVFEAPDGDAVAPALDWLLRAITELSPVALDGEFRASFHRR
ncbi:MAG: hypothetical protein JJU45_18895 [Acidimicrobiia bacterium]|nr:hypothetical protein [Acidimicrobiia bacterium]